MAGPTTIGVLLDYGTGKLQIWDILKAKALFTHTLNFHDHRPPLKFQFEASFEFYVNPHAVYEEEESTVLNQQIYGPNCLPILSETLPLESLRVLKKSQYEGLSEDEKVRQISPRMPTGPKRLRAAIGLSASKITSCEINFLPPSRLYLQKSRMIFRSLLPRLCSDWPTLRRLATLSLKL